MLSNGKVYFTLNGLYLGFSVGAKIEPPSIEYNTQVWSIVTATGWDGHVKFYFENFKFVPDDRKFEVTKQTTIINNESSC